MKRTLSTQVEQDLFDHIKAMCIIYSQIEGRKITISTLLRRAIVKNYHYGELEITQNNSIAREIIKSFT